MHFVILMFLACLAFVSEAQAAKKVAVYVEGNFSKEQKAMVNSAVMSRLSGAKEYRVYERNDAFIKALEREHDYQLSGEVSEDEVRKVGERLGVDYVIAVCAMLTSDERCQMSARLVNLETGEVVKTCNALRKYEGSSTVIALANNVAYRLISKNSK